MEYWSIATLDRRLRHFEIRYINYATPVEAVSAAVTQELNGPGKLLGYRALNQKLTTVHNVKVSRHLVHNVLAELDPGGLEARSLKKKEKKAENMGLYGLYRSTDMTNSADIKIDISHMYLQLFGYIFKESFVSFVFLIQTLTYA